jgi:hypothetical protein
MNPDDETATVEAEAREADAEFGSGFSGKPAEKPAAQAKPETAAPEGATAAEAEPAPEYVQITKKDWEDVRAAAARTASYDAQFSKLYGTLGNQQKLVAALQKQTPEGRKVEIPNSAFTELDRDFPELAKQLRGALEVALVGVHGTSTAAATDDGKIETMMQAYVARREIETLDGVWPNWRKLTGAVDASKETPDPEHPFRKWLAGKSLDYQNKINNADSALVIDRAIRTFERETKAAATAANGKPPAPATPQADARAQRIRDAVQPRGSNAVSGTNSRSEDDEFAAGFQSRFR